MGYESSELEGHIYRHGPDRGKLGYRNRLAETTGMEEGHEPIAKRDTSEEPERSEWQFGEEGESHRRCGGCGDVLDGGLSQVSGMDLMRSMACQSWLG